MQDSLPVLHDSLISGFANLQRLGRLLCARIPLVYLVYLLEQESRSWLDAATMLT